MNKFGLFILTFFLCFQQLSAQNIQTPPATAPTDSSSKIIEFLSAQV